MSKLQVYNSKGAKSGQIELPKEYVASKNLNLLTQAIHIYEDRAHKGTAKVKTRGEVSGTTAKMYRQKGTGNARHGSYKAPIFKGGGIAHGPKGIKRNIGISQKMKQEAMRVALGLKIKEGVVVIAEKLSSLAKTREAQILLDNVVKDLGLKTKKARLVLDRDKKGLMRLFRNIQEVSVSYWHELNARDAFLSNLLIIDKDALQNPKKSVQKTPLSSEVKTLKTTKSKTKVDIKTTATAKRKTATKTKVQAKKKSKK